MYMLYVSSLPQSILLEMKYYAQEHNTPLGIRTETMILQSCVQNTNHQMMHLRMKQNENMPIWKYASTFYICIFKLDLILGTSSV